MLRFHVVRHASPLGRWTYHECRPAALAAPVESIWEVHGTVTHARERILPNARVDLIVNLGPAQRICDGDQSRRLDVACVSGLQDRPLVIESALETHVFGVRLRPGARWLFDAPAHALRGRVVSLSDAAGSRGRDLSERISAAASFDERALAACRWMEEQCARASEVDAYVSRIACAIEASRGKVIIDELRRAAGVSRKKLVADFREQVGIPPKRLARIVRFRLASALLLRGDCSLAGAALAAGYYDQSHMSVDFRAFAATSAGQFAAMCYPDGNSAAAP